jgi:hypothetical protein
MYRCRSVIHRFFVDYGGIKLSKFIDGDVAILRISLLLISALLGCFNLAMWTSQPDAGASSLWLGLVWFGLGAIGFSLAQQLKAFRVAVNDSPLLICEVRELYQIPLNQRTTDEVLIAGLPLLLRHLEMELVANSASHPPSDDDRTARDQREAAGI